MRICTSTTSPAPGDWSYWDAAARNPSAFARDLWIIPLVNGVACMTSSSSPVSAGLFALKAEGEGASGLFLYNCPAVGDWTYWDAFSRNPSPIARDLWVMGAASAPVGIASVDDINHDGASDLALLKVEGAGDMNIYYYNALVPGDLTYWDCIARNPSPLARDFWVIPSGNGAVGLAAVNAAGVGSDLAIITREGAGDLNIYLYRNLAGGGLDVLGRPLAQPLGPCEGPLEDPVLQRTSSAWRRSTLPGRDGTSLFS